MASFMQSLSYDRLIRKEMNNMKNKIKNTGLLIMVLLGILGTQSCDDKMKKLLNTKWTLDQIVTEHGQVLTPKDFYTVFVQEDELIIKLDVNTCRLPFSIVGKNKINVKDKASCTRMCCDSNLGLSFLESLQGELLVEMTEDKLTIIGTDTMTFHRWTKNDVKREKSENYIKIRRTGCFGRCPIYEMTLFEDGSAAYNGKRFVNEVGNALHEFDVNRITNLFTRAEKLKFDELNPVYDNPKISDMESVFIEHNKKVIKVRYKMDAPKELLKFITDVHRCAIDAGWVPE